uniref:Cadherin domain-containing protein n=1 Tax=uncultured Planctomycetota bacterium TaxID=120965 RepID=H5SCA9_9BACT|nr:hypothetical protein HGMM_F08F10C14 [uncultured Planctomycetota bacterium]
MTYTLAGAPAGVSVTYVDANNAGLGPSAYLQRTIAYSNVPSNQPPKDFQVTVTVTASTDPPQIHTYTFTWTISDTNRIAPLGPFTNKEGERVEIAVGAYDALGNTLTYQLSGQPGTLTIDTATGLISGYISYRSVTASEGVKTFHVTVSVTGGDATDYRTFAWTIEDVDWFSQSLVAENWEGERLTLELPDTDAEGNPVTYISANGMPTGLSFDAAAGRFSGGISYANADGDTPLRDYRVSVSYQVSGVTATHILVWRIHDVNRIADIGDQVRAEGERLFIPVGPKRDRLGNILYYYVEGLPNGLLVQDSSEGDVAEISGFISYGNVVSNEGPRTYQIEVAVSDGLAIDRRTFQWTIHDTNRIPEIEPTLFYEGQYVRYFLNGYDASGESFTYALEGLDAIPGLRFDNSRGMIYGYISPNTVSESEGSRVFTLRAELHGVDAVDWRTFRWTIVNRDLFQDGETLILEHYEGDRIELVLPGATAVEGILPPGLTIQSEGYGLVITGTISSDAVDENDPSGSREYTLQVRDDDNTAPAQKMLVFHVVDVDERDTEKYWVQQALEKIKYDPKKIYGVKPSERAKEYIGMNAVITALYAEIFQTDPERYAWAGMATYASGIVGRYMLWIYRPSGRLEIHEINVLGYINVSIYKDLYWLFMADQAGRLKKIIELNTFEKLRGEEFHEGLKFLMQQKYEQATSRLAHHEQFDTMDLALAVLGEGARTVLKLMTRDVVSPFPRKYHNPPHTGVYASFVTWSSDAAQRLGNPALQPDYSDARTRSTWIVQEVVPAYYKFWKNESNLVKEEIRRLSFYRMPLTLFGRIKQNRNLPAG